MKAGNADTPAATTTKKLHTITGMVEVTKEQRIGTSDSVPKMSYMTQKVKANEMIGGKYLVTHIRNSY